ncbi:MAG: zinc-binding dehydrogenase [Candidatus Sulfotelmatobacter sp.]
MTKTRLDTISKLFEGGELISQVGATVPLEEARMAHEMLAGAPHKRGKIVLRVTDAT